LRRQDIPTVHPFHAFKCPKNIFYRKRYLFLGVPAKNGRIMVPSVLLVIRYPVPLVLTSIQNKMLESFKEKMIRYVALMTVITFHKT
jgi:hypothetical protein